MGPTLCGVLTGALTLALSGFAVYLGWPCPTMSNRLKSWKTEHAVYFTFRDRKLFLKGIYKWYSHPCNFKIRFSVIIYSNFNSFEIMHFTLTLLLLSSHVFSTLVDIPGEGSLKSAGTLLLLHGFPTMSYDWIKVWLILILILLRDISVTHIYGPKFSCNCL